MQKKALYLAGGGARGAYQAGVLKAIGHILQVKTLPFSSVTGVSVGSVNAAILVENADDFPAALEKLEWVWSELQSKNIYKASNYELSKSVLRNLSTLVVKQHQAGYLLDTSALKEFLSEWIVFANIEKNIASGFLESFEVIASCYETHQTVSFLSNNQPNFEDWSYPRHISQRTAIKAEHILASGALPLFFPPVNIERLHYGDGSMGLVAPLRGAIRFQVDKILIIGTRELPASKDIETLRSRDIAFAHILGTMMSGIFLDNLDRDIEMVNKMNEIATLLSIWRKHRSPWRPINTLHLRPSRGMSSMAQSHFSSMPALLRYLLNLLGAKNHSGDLVSFLLFEKEFTRELITLGYEDTMKSAKQVTDFFSDVNRL